MSRNHSSQHYTSPTRRQLPLELYRPRGWKGTVGAGTHLYAPVYFDYPGHARQGISMRELRLKGPGTQVHGANDPVFAHTGLQRIVFRLIWPGYEHVEWCRTLPLVAPNGAPITRVALAMLLASNFAHFIEKSQYETAASREWIIAPTCVRFEHLFLVSLQNTSEGIWQADVALDLS